jgi:hypothetical protein
MQQLVGGQCIERHQQGIVEKVVIGGGHTRSINVPDLAAPMGQLHSGYATKKPARVEWAMLLILMVAGDGIEPPTRGFSIPCSTN